MTIITIKDQFDGTYTVRVRGGGQFADVIESLKSNIPRWLRSYDPDARCWRVDDRDHLRAWLSSLQYWDDLRVEWSSERQYNPPRQPRPAPRADAYKALHLLETAPPELVKCAHKCLALLHHPDRGGDPEVMKRINNAVDVLTKAA